MKNLTTSFFLIVPLLLISFSSLATVYIWNGGNGVWSQPSNWTPVGIPGTADSVVIADGHLMLDAPDTVAHITFTGDTLSGNHNLLVQGDFLWNSGVLTGTGNITIMGKLKCSTGPVTIHDKVINLEGGGSWTNITFTMHGTSEFVIPAGDTLLIDVTSGTREMNGPSGKVTNAGTIIKSGSQQFWMDTPALINTGTLVVNGGTLTNGFNGPSSTHSGANIQISSGCQIRLDGGTTTFSNTTISGNGSISLTRAGAQYYFNGGNTLAIFSLQLSSVAYFNESLTFTNLSISSNGTFNSNFNHTIASNMGWTSGTIAGSCTLTVNGNFTSGNANNTLDGCNLLMGNGGAWTNTSYFIHNNATLTIPIGKVLTINTSSGNRGIFGTQGNLVNNGTITKTGTYYFANDRASFTHTGTMNVNQGQFYTGYLGPSCTYNGSTINIASGAYFAPNGGSHTFTNTTIAGSGNFLIENGYAACFVNLNAGTSVSTYTWVRNSATLTLNTALTIPAMDLDYNSILNGGADLLVTGILGMWGAGAVSGGGIITVNGSCNATNGNKTITNKTFMLNGGGTWYRSSFTMNTGSKFIIPVGKTLTIHADNAQYGIIGQVGIIENYGKIIKSGVEYFAGNSLRLVNHGDITINQGILGIGYTGINSEYHGDSIVISANTSFVLNGGIHDFENTKITGSGTFIIENGLLPCTANVNQNNQIMPGNFTIRIGATAYVFHPLTIPQVKLTGGGKLITQDTLDIVSNLHMDFGSFNGSGVINVHGNFLATASSNSVLGILVLNGSGLIDNSGLNVSGNGKLIIPPGDSLIIIDNDNSLIGGSGTIEVEGKLAAYLPGLFGISTNMNLQGILYSDGDIRLGTTSNRTYNIYSADVEAMHDIKLVGGTVNLENTSVMAADTFDISGSLLHIYNGNTIDDVHFHMHDEAIVHIHNASTIAQLSIIDTTYSFTRLYIHDMLLINDNLKTNFAFIYMIDDISVQGFTNLSNTNFEGPGTLHSYGNYSTEPTEYVHFDETTWMLHNHGNIRRLSLSNSAKIINLAGKKVTIGIGTDNTLYDDLNWGGSFENYGILEKTGSSTFTIQCPFFNYPMGEIHILQGNLIFE